MSIEEILLQKVKQNHDDMTELMSEFKLLKKLITGNGEVGMAEDVRNNTKFRHNSAKLIWILISGAIGQTIAFLALLIHLMK